MRRAGEIIHQELARRVTKAKGLFKGSRKVKEKLRLIKMKHENLRLLSRKFDGKDGGVGECDMCCIRPGFKERES
jgi:hypothetical protein